MHLYASITESPCGSGVGLGRDERRRETRGLLLGFFAEEAKILSVYGIIVDDRNIRN